MLGAPLGFRGTCYYYRKAYYRAFFADPMACAVGEPRGSGYAGEASFPFVLQNIHRYLIYLAIPILFFLWWDIVRAFTFDGHFGIGVGSLVLLASNTLLTHVHVLVPFDSPSGGRPPGLFLVPCRGRPAPQGVGDVELAERAPHGVGVVEPVARVLGRPLRAPVFHGRAARPEDHVSEHFETHEHDVLVIGAGGAGLRAAIEASAAGADGGTGVQVAARQGAHRDGRGRRRRGARPTWIRRTAGRRTSWTP